MQENYSVRLPKASSTPDSLERGENTGYVVGCCSEAPNPGPCGCSLVLYYLLSHNPALKSLGKLLASIFSNKLYLGIESLGLMHVA